MIDILVPVLGRPQNAQPLSDSIRFAATLPYTLTWLCSQGDSDEIDACKATDHGVVVTVSWPAGEGDYAKKINFGYQATSLYGNEYVFTAADDVEFEQGWDQVAVAAAGKAGMVGTNDDANPLVKRGRHSTHTLFSRRYIDEVGATFFDGPGVVYHEGYKHQWVDTEAVKAATDRGEWAFARRAVVRHNHPFFRRGVKRDATYEKALGDAPHDSALYRERLKRWTTGLRAGTVL